MRAGRLRHNHLSSGVTNPEAWSRVETFMETLLKDLRFAFRTLKKTPLVALRFGLADVRFPKVILDQKETAARRRIAIQQEEAEKQIRLVKLQADLEAARAERQIRRERAQAVLEENEIYAKSVNEKYLAYRRLEVLEKLATSKNTKWVPFQALGTVGQSVAQFREERTATKQSN